MAGKHSEIFKAQVGITRHLRRKISTITLPERATSESHVVCERERENHEQRLSDFDGCFKRNGNKRFKRING